jgi:hypothetical protein
MQRVGNLSDGWILGYHQMEPASDKVNVRIDLGRLSNNVGAPCSAPTVMTPR